MTLRRFTAVVATAALSVGLVACSPPAEEEPAPRGDTSVNVGWNQPFYSYNDDTVIGNASANAVVLYLMRTGFNYYDENLVLTPDESFGTYEKLSDDPLRVRYTVNEDVTWSDGTPVDAADLLLSWAALSSALNTVEGDAVERNPETGEPQTSEGVYFDSGSPGLRLVTQTPELGEDGRSVTFTYDEPFADWELAFDVGVPAHATAMNALDIEDPQEAKDALVTAIQERDEEALREIANFWNTGFNYSSFPEDELLRLSNGAYEMTEFEENQFLTLEANDDYVGDRPAAIDKVTIRWNEDPLASVQALENGELDLISPQSSPDVLQAVQGIEGVTVETGVEGTYEHVDLTFDNGGPFDPTTYGGDEDTARAVRLAFLKTVPRQEILDKLIEPLQPDADVRDSQVIAPGAPGYEEMVQQNGSEQFAEPDIAGAKALLAEAGVETPVEVRFLYAAGNVRREEAFELIRQSAQQAGFKVIDRGNAEWGSLLGSGSYDVTTFGWERSSTAVTESSANYRSDGVNNFSGYSSARVDELYDELQVETDADRQQELLIEVEQELWSDGFGLPLYQFPAVTAHNENISGVQPISIAPTIFFGYWNWKAGGAD